MSFFTNLSSLFGTARDPHAVHNKPKPFIKPQPLANKVAKTQELPTAKATSAPAAAASAHQTPQAAKPAQAINQNQLAQQAAEQIREAQAKAREILLEAKSEALTLRSKAEKESRELAHQIEDQQRELARKIDRIDLRLEQLDSKEKNIDQDRQALDQQRTKLEADRQKVVANLEKIAGLTKDQAHQELLAQLEQTLSKQMAQVVKQREEATRLTAEEVSRDILLDAMRHGATDYVAEYTVSVVTLPNEEAKGKIIGKAGRNIHAFEKETGVDVDLDVSPTEVRLSCFDPMRREIARVSLERLIKDGRIQPARIEEVVAKVRSEVDKAIFEAGKTLCNEVGVYNLPVDLVKLLGKFKYRFSYGQNLIAHTLEETKMAMKLASELKLDVTTVKLGCLLHDIGKVSEEAEGSHVELGIKIAKRFNLPQAVVDCIAQHHEDESFTGPEQMVVYIADAISGARPGARYENYEEYVKRLTQLEEIATHYKEVKSAFAIQAGREIRVLLEPETSKDDDVQVLATKIRDEIKEKVTYPGTVTVTVIRERRSQAVAS